MKKINPIQGGKKRDRSRPVAPVHTFCKFNLQIGYEAKEMQIGIEHCVWSVERET